METCPSAKAIASNHDVLSEILIRLPVRSLFRFKSVSKDFLSLITTHRALSLRVNPDPSSVSGVFINPGHPYFSTGYRGLDFIPLNEDPDYEPRDLTVIPNLSAVITRCSTHGLMIVAAFNEIEKTNAYHVLNPTTKQFAILPDPHVDWPLCLGLAFNPSRSPHYKVISLSEMRYCNGQGYFQIEIYSSETGTWRCSGGSFTVDAVQLLPVDGVYWNEAIHFWSNDVYSYYFNVEEERLARMPMPPIPEGRFYYDRCRRFMFESRDHFHVIDIYDRTQFNVFEMERDYSEWFVKYRVDLRPVVDAFPTMRQFLNPSPNYPSPYDVLSLVRQKKEDESCLLLNVPGKIVRYNLVDKTFEAILDAECADESELGLRYNGYIGLPYIKCYYSFV
ncbi:hypothetical protein NMG60_11028972 [Bertholletia excelsa]